MRPQINYRVVSRAHARIKELAGAAAASTLVSILTTAVSPRITESWKSHLLLIVAVAISKCRVQSVRGARIDPAVFHISCCPG
jgi:hypothetical protein